MYSKWFCVVIVWGRIMCLCVCRLPFPWLLWSLFSGMIPVQVSSNGLFCAIVLLFLMLLFVIISIAACKWRMSKLLGFIMFMLYFVFLVVSVMLEDRVITCPVSVWGHVSETPPLHHLLRKHHPKTIRFVCCRSQLTLVILYTRNKNRRRRNVHEKNMKIWQKKRKKTEISLLSRWWLGEVKPMGTQDFDLASFM